MPAKLALPTSVQITGNTTTLSFNSTNNGYLETSDMHLNGSNQLVIDESKKYYVGISVTIEQNSTTTFINTVNVEVRRNGNLILSNQQSYNENDQITVTNAAFLQLNAGDVITVDVNFVQFVANKIFVLAYPACTFLNII
jgi:hypothetical protein